MSIFKFWRKEIPLKNKELDEFLNNKNESTKYYLEKNYPKNKVFRYLLLLRLKGVNLNEMFDNFIKQEKIKK